MLGDCWLLSTCAALAKQEWLLHRVLDPGQVTVTCNVSRVSRVTNKTSHVSRAVMQVLFGPGYSGLVRVRLWRYGHWVTVCIDDR